MNHSRPHVQALRPSFVLWDDILFVFAKALYIRHEAKGVSFMKDAESVPLKPLRIEAVPDAVLDLVVDKLIVHRDRRDSVIDNVQATSNTPVISAQNHQSPQGHTADAAFRDISPTVVKASLGDLKSQVVLGDMYRVGDGVEQDFEEARHWYLKAPIKETPQDSATLDTSIAWNLESNGTTRLH
ncbi:MAG: hypothetical protein JOS17DRAFT_822235 [Linnemannia elongata]|nr:MAG: hypothetical protein JOS17DRAFT_822235 [Linnemannia elongata]